MYETTEENPRIRTFLNAFTEESSFYSSLGAAAAFPNSTTRPSLSYRNRRAINVLSVLSTPRKKKGPSDYRRQEQKGPDGFLVRFSAQTDCPTLRIVRCREGHRA